MWLCWVTSEKQVKRVPGKVQWMGWASIQEDLNALLRSLDFSRCEAEEEHGHAGGLQRKEGRKYLGGVFLKKWFLF